MRAVDGKQEINLEWPYLGGNLFITSQKCLKEGVENGEHLLDR